MGLTSSLFIGRSALSAAQIAMQVTGNNISNAGTEGYHRQRVEMDPLRGGRVGQNFIGRGVEAASVRRAIDTSIQARMRSSMSQEQTAFIEASVLDSIESLTNELSDRDLSSAMGRFFNAWSELANNPTSGITQAAVIEEGAAAASYIRGVRSDLLEQRTQIENDLASSVNRTNTLLDQIAQLNRAVVNGEQGVGEDGNLRDQRDQLIDELSGLLDVQVIEQESGATDILVDSMPVVLGASSRGLELDVRTVTDPATNERELEVRVMSVEDQEEVRVDQGRIGALLEQRESAVQRTIDDLDSLAGQLIFQVNKLHSSGRPANGMTSFTSERSFSPTEQTLAFNDPDNVTMNGLPFSVENGSFKVTVVDENGDEFSQTIMIDLDGIRASDGTLGVDEDTTLADVAGALNGMANLNASITANGELQVTTDAGYEVFFSEDTSGLLATLGVNTYFTGVDASDIAIRADLESDRLGLVTGLGSGDNSLALAVAGLRETPLAELGGVSLTDFWLKSVETTAVEASSARTRLASLEAVRQNLQAQERAVGGVSMDEESMNLILYQQQYNGAARFISVVDEMTQILMSLV